MHSNKMLFFALKILKLCSEVQNNNLKHLQFKFKSFVSIKMLPVFNSKDIVLWENFPGTGVCAGVFKSMFTHLHIVTQLFSQLLLLKLAL